MKMTNLKSGKFFLLKVTFFVTISIQTIEMHNNFNKFPIGFAQESPAIETFTAEGHEAFLPCDIASPSGDSPLLVIFFKGSQPIYSIDSRDGTIVNAIHWSSPEVKRRLISYKIMRPPYGLIIPKVTVQDAGDYHCRVDFVNSPTRNLRVKLRVIAPPSAISIIDEDGQYVDKVVGPFPFGSTVTFACLAHGGTPRPQILWLRKGQIVDQIIEEVKGNTTRNMLTLQNLPRNYLGSIFTCQVSNSNLTKSLTKSFEIDMLFPPDKISITMPSEPFEAGHEYRLVCVSSGSRPPANLTWWKDGRQMQSKSKQMVLGGRNISSSDLILLATRIDNGSIVACRSSNSLLPGTAIEESNKIFVNYPPNLLLRVGLNMNLFDVEEDDDIYFECKVDANPKVNYIEWYRNGVLLKLDAAAGVIVSGQSLVLQSVDRHFSGKYNCRASNKLGSNISNYLNLVVKYRPTCTLGQREVHGGSNNEPVNVSCELEAEPPAEIMHWAFNTTSELIKLRSKATKGYSRMTVMSYIPKSHLDYGSLLCWGENKVGKQRTPCVFQVVPASPPEPVKNCSAWQNASATMILIIACTPGWNGGLNQTFTLQMRKETNGPIVMKDEGQRVPVFTVPNLSPGKEFYFSIRSINEQGDSSSTIFHHFTPIDIAEERLSADSSTAKKSNQLELVENKTSLLVALIGGTVIAVGISCSIILFVIRNKGIGLCRRSLIADVVKNNGDDEENELHTQNPDVVLISADGEIGDDDEKELKNSKLSPSNDMQDDNKRKVKVARTQGCCLRSEDKLVDIASLYNNFRTKKSSPQAKTPHVSSPSSDILRISVEKSATTSISKIKEPPDSLKETLYRKVNSDQNVTSGGDLRSPVADQSGFGKETLTSSTCTEFKNNCIGAEGTEQQNKMTKKLRRATLIKTFSGETITENNV